MLENIKVNKKPYLIGLVGLVVASSLIIYGGSSKGNTVVPEKKPNIEVKKKLTDKEQFELKPVNELIKSVVNRFDDEISKKRAESTAQSLLKEYILKKNPNSNNWGDEIYNASMDDLKKWNDEQEKNFSASLKEMSEHQEVKNVPVEEIAQNNPLYILQETKVIQKELYEQWMLILKKKMDDKNLVENKDNGLETIKLPLPTEGADINSKEKINNDKLRLMEPMPPTDLDNIVKPDSVKKEETVVIPLNNDKDKIKEQKTGEKKDEIEKVKFDLVKAKDIEKDLTLKKEQINEELTKNTQSLKSVEDEIANTKKELDRLEKELKDMK